MDEEQDNQKQADEAAQEPQRPEREPQSQPGQNQDQTLDDQVDQVGRQTPGGSRQPIAKGDVFRGNDLHQRIDLLSTAVHSAHYRKRDAE